MAGLATEDLARGESLDRWVGNSGVELDVLITNLRQRGSVRFFTTAVRGENGSLAQVEISAVAIGNGGQPSFGFAIRNIGPRLQVETQGRRARLPRSIEQLTELIGRVLAEGSGARVDRRDREALHRGGAGADRRQPRVGRRDARA